MAVTYSEAISRISNYLDQRNHVTPSSSSLSSSSNGDVLVRLEKAVGRTLAKEYAATIDAPPFDNSGQFRQDGARLT
jgi:molybdopterin biosynthesis enzyme